MSIASEIFKLVAIKEEITFGVLPTATAAQQMRRVTSTLDLSKATYASKEVRSDFQVADFRHGARQVGGKLSGELSSKTYAAQFAAVLKRDFTAGTVSAGVSITVAGTDPVYTLTRATGSYLTDGLKIGDVIRLSVGTLNANNINKNLLITDLTALVATVMTLNASPLTPEGPVTGCTATVVGKKTYIPQTGHTNKSFAIEHFYSDLVQSEVFTGCKFSKISLSLPPTGMATVDFEVMGKDMTTAAAQYFTSPTAVTTTGTLAAVNGIVRIGGVVVATLTGLTMELSSPFASAPTVGSNTIPNLSPDAVMISGQATVFFDGIAMRTAFINEAEIDITAVFTADNSATADFISIVLPRVKLGGNTKAGGAGGISQTIPFTALLNVNGGTGLATEKTTVSIQDSAA